MACKEKFMKQMEDTPLAATSTFCLNFKCLISNDWNKYDLGRGREVT